MSELESRLDVTLDGSPAYLYWFSIGRGDDRHTMIVSYPTPLSRQEVRKMLAAAVSKLPESLPIDPNNPEDLLDRLLPLAGFTDVSLEIPVGLWLPHGGGYYHERELLEKALRHPLRGGGGA